MAAVPCGDQPSAHRQGGSGGGAPARPLPRQRRVELGVRRGAQAEQTVEQAEALQRQVALLRKDYRQIANVLSGV